MVPGQVVTREIIDFMLALDVKEIHGYNKDAGLKVIKPEGFFTDDFLISRPLA
jgi:arginine decarboxylase